ncbi:unnamed protein product [Lupinus luteus]|uniref:Uncharacterized protein n=1 Tax=Lupinus luteus TaxID=3873 RepID=A0AAV1Y1G1_LUPLU
MITYGYVNNVSEVEGAKKSYGVYNSDNNSVKLFVFGDSYVDTGNYLNSTSYKSPNGITFPGHPSGRFGNGHILTDYLASFFKIGNPTPYALKNSSNLQNGMNFAFGGTGVFKTMIDGPNLTVQIDSFEQLIKQNVYSKSDVESSIVLVNTGSNDYITFLLKDKNLIGIAKYIKSLGDEFSINLKRIHSLGANKIIVSLLEPMGCYPAISVASSYHDCINQLNKVSRYHNKMILQNVEGLNKKSGKLVFTTLDLYNSFLSTIKDMQKSHQENSTLMNPLQPCCAPVKGVYECGTVDENGKNEYNLCKKPELSFFWDIVHPSQNGWYSIFKKLEPSLSQITGTNFLSL